MKVAVIGANGQLGTEVCRSYERDGYQVEALTHEDLAIEDAEQTRSVLTTLRPDVVVNTAAMHHLERCEEDPTRAFTVNGTGAHNVATQAQAIAALLIHVSTDYVFDGSKPAPYTEEDCARPLNVYGVTKLGGEHFVRALCERHLVVRVSGLFGDAPCRAKGGKNFVDLMLHLARERGAVRVVDDERVSPTPCRFVADNLVPLGESGATGLFHMTSQGECTWYEFAARIFDLAGVEVQLDRADPGEFASAVQRPAYSVLDNAALRAADLDRMPHWIDALGWYLGER